MSNKASKRSVLVQHMAHAVKCDQNTRRQLINSHRATRGLAPIQYRDVVHVNQGHNPIFPNDEIGRWAELIYDALYRDLKHQPQCDVVLLTIRALLTFLCVCSDSMIDEIQPKARALAEMLRKCVAGGYAVSAIDNGHSVFCHHTPKCIQADNESSSGSDVLARSMSDASSDSGKCDLIDDEASERNSDDDSDSDSSEWTNSDEGTDSDEVPVDRKRVRSE